MLLETTTLKSFIKKLGNSGKDINADMSESLEDVMDLIAVESEQNAPVDTGNLRDEIKVDVKGLLGVVGVNSSAVPYADIVHYNDPFLKNAFETHEVKAYKKIANDYEEAVADAVKESR